MTALDRGGRWARRVTALVILALGTVDLLAAARVSPVPRAGVLGVDYAVAALVGSRYVVLAAGLTAVMTVRGLLHGKRTAWWAALAAAVTSLPGHPVTDANVASQAAALAALVTLLGCRRVFIARADPALARRGVAMLVAGELAVFGYAAAGLYQIDTDFRHPNTLASALPNAARLLFLLPVHLEPTTQHGHAFVDSVRVAALLVACAGLSRLVAAVVGRPGHAADRAQVARLLRRHGRTGLAHFHLLDDKNWVISSDHGAFIGYKVVGTTAVALGEPVGDPHSCRVAALDFLQLCALNGWTPVFHQVTEAGRALLESVGMKALHIGEEAIVDVRTWSPQRREYKSLRSALRRCERAGYRVIDLPHPVDDPTLAQLKEVSDAWLAAGGHRERTFTLGHFDADYLRSTPIVAVIDAKGTVHAFANLLPSYQSLDGSFDLMRRRPEAVNGVMDYLFVALIERFRAVGYAGMNLGLAPLSGAGTGGGLADRVMRTLYQHGGDGVPLCRSARVQTEVAAQVGAALPGLPRRDRPAQGGPGRSPGRRVARPAPAHDPRRRSPAPLSDHRRVRNTSAVAHDSDHRRPAPAAPSAAPLRPGLAGSGPRPAMATGHRTVDPIQTWVRLVDDCPARRCAPPGRVATGQPPDQLAVPAG
ncbi:MAG: bifunctional lysylphosphatidylglycerol flippase/synthetase MprF [Pseudonocardiaceae bacterium]